jgi:DNA-binding NarL/FixJ family response regulator
VIRIVIADDHRVVLAGLEQVLETFDDVELVGIAEGGEAAVALCAELTPDVLLLDLMMPGLDGIGATKAVVSASPATKVVLFTSFSEGKWIVAALDAGAVGYLLKDTAPSELHAALRAVARGEAPLAPKAAAALLEERGARRWEGAMDPADLTTRELDVLKLVIAGHSNKQIARQLGISEKTVKGHLTNLYQRIRVSDRTQAALWAERSGIFTRGVPGP